MSFKVFRMIFVGIVLCCACFLTAVDIAYAEGTIAPDVVELSNKVMLDIYQEIFQVKSDYPDLRDFGEQHLFKNQHGVYVIRYEFKHPKSGDMYRFGVTVTELDDTEFASEADLQAGEVWFHYRFPVANLKISGFQQKRSLLTRFDLIPVVSKCGVILEEYQQGFIPLRVFVHPVKEAFRVNEDIEFDVILENTGKWNMNVRSLGYDTLYFLIKNQTWGTSPLSGQRGGSDEVLRSGEKKVLRFKGESFHKPQDVEIICFYRLSVQGVNPMAKANIVIQE